MQIRPASAADAPAIAAIWNPIIRDTLITFTTEEKTDASLAKTLRDKAALDHPFLLAADGENVLGFATYGPFRGGPGYAHSAEHTIILGEASRGRGIGRLLLTEIENRARKSGIHALIGGVSSANTPAQAFHLACGFSHVATIPEVGRKQGNWLDLVLYQKLF